ncbi:hypothetical protein PCC8801_4387 [Rippkaea orientalis PCC 8801]|uniref:Uncharacterized protein n=1 Tax=Rippkaea orientalis (strain PCC 8801 / RF-1) TaxID=41431 RepID=B7JVH6_RIPO1|nr:hypothetical protein PCC8801_4387 [Rippkaea orientalis PCC 8801]
MMLIYRQFSQYYHYISRVGNAHLGYYLIAGAWKAI